MPVGDTGLSEPLDAEPVRPVGLGPEFGRQVERLALLEDPVRRALYAYVAEQAGFVGRDQASAAVGVARGLAAFHLDKLAADGLLEVTYRRQADRSGPGAGRPAKLYRRSDRQVSISLPPRDYELLSHLFARGLDRAMPAGVVEGLHRAAERAGGALADEARRLAGRRANRRRLIQAAVEALGRRGFEPIRAGAEIRLRNCPFRSVAREHESVVCPLNLAMLAGFAAALPVKGLSARLEPRDDACCVALRTAAP